MDPNANLREQLEISRRILDDANPMTQIDQCEASERLAELVQALNMWILGGGFLPTVWGRR